MAAGTHGVCLLGAGIFATIAHLPAIAAVCGPLELKAVYSRSSASVTSLAKAAAALPTITSPLPTYFDVASEGVDATAAGNLDDLLARTDIQTVIMCLPIPLMPELLEKVWKAGKHVISEKPVATSVDQAKTLIELWEKEYKPQGINWIVGEQYTYEKAFVKAKEIIAEGMIGELRTFHLDFCTFVPKGSKHLTTTWRFLLDGGVHHVAGLREILPCRLTALTATRALLQPYLAPFDTLQGLFRTDSAAIGTFNITFGNESTPSLRQYVFRGSKATLLVEMFPAGAQRVTLTPVASPGVVPAAAGVNDSLVIELKENALRDEFVSFSEALVAGMGSEEARDVDRKSGPRAALKDLEVIEKALKSGESGLWETLEA
ncbi:NAD dependent oxidoreductase [Pseudohyphozyma bogoriensis]|nr:NAD dependent oxidoreductase [Pseudohyphozyma bogoriensis]